MGTSHSHTAASAHKGRLRLVFGISLTIMLVEVVGSLLTRSVALLAEAGHVLTDVAGLAFSLIAISLAERPATARRTFGWQRAEILAAMLNAFLLMGVGVFIIVESIRRLISPSEVAANGMITFALLAVVGNAAAVWLLVSGQRKSLNIRGAYLEVLSDLIGSGVVVIASVIIKFTRLHTIDAIAGLIIGAMILPRTWKLLREALDVLVEATPKHIDLDVVREHLLGVEGVIDVHDLHVWTITSGVPVLSAHVVTSDTLDATLLGGALLDKLGACVSDHFDIEHSTFQLEPSGHIEHEGKMHD